MKWIKISEQLPEMNKNILIYTIYKTQCEALLSDYNRGTKRDYSYPFFEVVETGQTCCGCEPNTIELKEVTHWADLLETPKNLE